MAVRRVPVTAHPGHQTKSFHDQYTAVDETGPIGYADAFPSRSRIASVIEDLSGIIGIPLHAGADVDKLVPYCPAIR